MAVSEPTRLDVLIGAPLALPTLVVRADGKAWVRQPDGTVTEYQVDPEDEWAKKWLNQAPVVGSQEK